MILLDISVSKKAQDIVQKYVSGLFKDSTLEFYGIKTARVKELINVEFQIIEVRDSSSDYIFLLEDNTYLHFEFQTKYNKKDLIRFANYDLRIYERDKRSVKTVIIYSSEVKKADTILEIGSLSFRPEKVMMNKYDGNTICMDLEEKIEAKQELTDVDVLNLVFLPLMNNTKLRKELAIKSVELAKHIPDKTKSNLCIASIIAFGSKYLSEEEIQGFLEVIKMTDIAALLVEDAVKENSIKLTKELTEKHKKEIQEKTKNIALNLIKTGMSPKEIMKVTGIDEKTLIELSKKMN